MTSKPEELGKLERPVKMDYSVTYRENEKLDVGLDEQLMSLKRSAQRVMTEKEEELETARADADKILKLKEAVNNRQEREPSLAILCQSMRTLRRTSSIMSSGGKRRTSSVNGGVDRRISMVSSARESLDEHDGVCEENGDVDYAVLSNGQLPDMKKMSITERRLAKERDQFSAKNLFNVRRTSNAATYIMESPRRPESSSDNFTPTTATQPNPSLSNRHGRPKTSPAAYNHRGRSSKNNRGYLRPTTASSSRLATFVDDGEDDSFPRAPRRPRSRRELQKLSELKIDPFGDEESERLESASSSGNPQQDLLHSLHVGQAQLQARVSVFLKTMEDFNKRQRKSGLEQILEAT